MAPVRRCVFGCLTDGISLHNFPNPRRFPEQYQKWVELVGEPVEGLLPDEIFGKKKVCDLHFTIDDRNRNNRLNAIATPVPFPCLKRKRNRRKSLQGSAGNRQYVKGISNCRIVEPIYTSSMKLLIAENEPAHVADSAGASSPGEEAHHEDIVPDAAMMYQEEEMDSNSQDDAFEEVPEEHIGFTCNVCHLAITGFRYTCVQCNDLDLCGACEADKAHRQHYVLRIPSPKPTHEIQAVLDSIRSHVATAEDYGNNNNEVDLSLKSEINSEGEDGDGMAPYDEPYGYAPNNEHQDVAYANSEATTSTNREELDPNVSEDLEASASNDLHDDHEDGPVAKKSRTTMSTQMEPVASTSTQEPHFQEIEARAQTPQRDHRPESLYGVLALQAQVELPNNSSRWPLVTERLVVEHRRNGTSFLNANQIRIQAVARRRRNHVRPSHSPNIRNLGSVRLILRIPNTVMRPNSNQAA